MRRKKSTWHVLGYTSPQHMISTHRKWEKEWQREDRRVIFACKSCGRGFYAFQKCRIKKVYCGMCDTGTDADFDRYSVQVQNGEGYYDAAGTFHYYENWRDD